MVISLTNSKGGVGKTTIAVHLAVWLAERGDKVMFVDSDVQGSSSVWLNEVASDLKNLQIVRLLTADDVLTQLPQIQKEASYVVADGPAGLSEVTRALFCCSDLAVLPCGPSVIDLRALIEADKVIEKIQKIREGLPRISVVPNKIQPHYRLTKDLLHYLRTEDIPCGNGLHLRQAYPDAAGQGTVVWRMNTKSAREATAEMQFLFQQLIAHESKSPIIA